MQGELERFERAGVLEANSLDHRRQARRPVPLALPASNRAFVELFNKTGEAELAVAGVVERDPNPEPVVEALRAQVKSGTPGRQGEMLTISPAVQVRRLE